jgi:hypothetical protein
MVFGNSGGQLQSGWLSRHCPNWGTSLPTMMAIGICAEAFGQIASAITPSQDWSSVRRRDHGQRRTDPDWRRSTDAEIGIVQVCGIIPLIAHLKGGRQRTLRALEALGADRE